jgi:hypothetical protein
MGIRLVWIGASVAGLAVSSLLWCNASPAGEAAAAPSATAPVVANTGVDATQCLLADAAAEGPSLRSLVHSPLPPVDGASSDAVRVVALPTGTTLQGIRAAIERVGGEVVSDYSDYGMVAVRLPGQPVYLPRIAVAAR